MVTLIRLSVKRIEVTRCFIKAMFFLIRIMYSKYVVYGQKKMRFVIIPNKCFLLSFIVNRSSSRPWP